MTEADLINSPLCVLAVDPGLSGAVVKLGRGGFSACRDFKTRNDIADAIADLAKGADCGVIEGVRAFPGQGVCSVFSFGRSAGAADAALHLSLKGQTIEEVFPQKWQNFFRARLGIPREVQFNSREIMSQILPSFCDRVKRKKDHNTADAALMAVWKILSSSSMA